MWKQLRCPSTDGWVSKMWSTYTTKYYSTFKRKEILTYTIWMKLEDMTLSEISQSRKDKY